MTWGPQRWRPGLATGLLTLLLGAAAIASGQGSRVQVETALVPPSLPLLAALRGGLSAWSASVIETGSGSPVACGALSEAAPVDALVSVRWMAGGSVALCFATRGRSFTRGLGPFVQLHARAREELVTVIEAGLETLLLVDGHDAAPRLEPAQEAVTSDMRAAVRPPAPVNPSQPDMSRARPLPRSAESRAEWTLGLGYALAFWGGDAKAQGLA